MYPILHPSASISGEWKREWKGRNLGRNAPSLWVPSTFPSRPFSLVYVSSGQVYSQRRVGRPPRRATGTAQTDTPTDVRLALYTCTQLYKAEPDHGIMTE